MDKTSLMHVAELPRERDRDTQEMRYVQWPAKQSFDRRTAGISQHQRHAVVVLRQRDWLRRPCIVQIVPQSVFVTETIEAAGSRPLYRRKHNEDRIPVAVGAIAPSPLEDAITVLPRHPEATVLANVEPRGWDHPPDSTARPVRRY